MGKDNPYFKFHVNQFLTGNITDQTDALQGVFSRFMAYYWSQDCYVTYQQATSKKFKARPINQLVDAGIIKRDGDVLSVSFLDEQHAERQGLSKKNSKNGKTGGESRSSKKQPQANASAGASTHVSQGEGEKINKDKEKKGEGEKIGITHTGDLVEIYFTDLPNSTYFERLCKDLAESKDQVAGRLPEFRTACRTFYPRMNDFADHFKNWYRKNRDSPQQAGNATDRHKKDPTNLLEAYEKINERDSNNRAGGAQ